MGNLCSCGTVAMRAPPSESSKLVNAPVVGGGKNISFWAGVVLLVNNITGPGIPNLPNLFAEAGWLVPTLCIATVWAMTTLSGAMYAEAMRYVPGNENFRGRVEYSTVIQHFFGWQWYLAAQVGLNGALQSLNIISVIQSAQVMDAAISALLGKSCALNLSPFRLFLTSATGHSELVTGSDHILSCVDMDDLSGGNAWGCHLVVSVGFLVTSAMAIPYAMIKTFKPEARAVSKV
jgi:hypothetical protein